MYISPLGEVTKLSCILVFVLENFRTARVDSLRASPSKVLRAFGDGSLRASSSKILRAFGVEIENCVLRGALEDVTAYMPTTSNVSSSVEESVFQCAERCSQLENASSVECSTFSYRPSNGLCLLYRAGAAQSFSYFDVSGSAKLLRAKCNSPLADPAEDRQKLLMSGSLPYELQGAYGGEVLNSFAFPDIPALLREPLKITPSFLSRLAKANPHHIRAIGDRPRVLYYNTDRGGGLSDRMWMFYNLLAIATSLHAALAVDSPQALLTKEHGDPLQAADWWDSYITTDPPLYKFKEVECDADYQIRMSPDANAFFENMTADMIEQLLDPEKPLCLTINFHYYELQDSLKSPNAAVAGSGILRDLLRFGMEKVSFSPGNTVVSLAKRAVLETPQLQQGYNMAHVRQGDKGAPECTSAANVVERMQRLMAIESHSLPPSTKSWLVMSNGGKVFFDELSRCERGDISILTESDLPLLVGLKDNFLRYAILQHLYGGAQRVLYTYKPMRLRPNHADHKMLSQRLCGEWDEPEVPFASGGTTFKMNFSRHFTGRAAWQ